MLSAQLEVLLLKTGKGVTMALTRKEALGLFEKALKEFDDAISGTKHALSPQDRAAEAQAQALKAQALAALIGPFPPSGTFGG